MSGLFLKIINMSISASWLVLAVLLLRFVLKKAPKWVNVLLWGIVAVRLAFPFSIESVLSLIPSAETINPGIMMDTVPSVQTGVPAINNVINPVIGSSLAPAPGASANPLQIWIPILSIVWAVGVAALLLYTFVSYWRLRRKVSEAVILRDNIYQSENVASPFVLGVFRPRIYLPYNMNGQDLSHVVAHEQAHIRRRDHWWKPLVFLLLTIHWFNPLMWLAYVLLCRDIELACDEKVIKDLDNGQRADYTQALVACSVNRRMIAACPLAFGEVGVKERVKSVMNYKKPVFWVIILAVITCAVVAVCFLTNPAGTALTKWTIDEVDMSAALSDLRSMTVRYNSEFVSCNDGDSNRFIATMGKIRVGRNSISQSRDYNRDHSFTITINDNLHLHFSFDFSEIWVDNGVKPSFSYPVTNPETARELMLDFSFTHKGTVEQWFDYLDTMSEMQWDGQMEANIPEFPDVTFRWTYGEMMAVTGNEITSLYIGMPIWNTYFCDLTGDGLPDLCSTLSIGSGMIDNRIIVYDYANGASYTLEDRGNYDYTLRLNDSDGQLYADKILYNSEEKVSTGRLRIANGFLKIDEDPLDTAISAAILNHYASSQPDGLIHVESHVLLANEGMSGTPLFGSDNHMEKITAYLLVLQQKYSTYGGTLEGVGGSYGPAAITFAISGSGEYILEEYWEPRDGGNYVDDVRDKFPGSSADDALSDQAYIEELKAQNYNKALAYLNSTGSLDIRIGELLDMICASPAHESAPDRYIEAHEAEYQELLSYGEYTLRYCFTEFLQDGETDLRGLIMASSCEDILLAWGEALLIDGAAPATGQEWFDAFKESAESLNIQYNDEDMKKYYPGNWLLLQMINE